MGNLRREGESRAVWLPYDSPEDRRRKWPSRRERLIQRAPLRRTLHRLSAIAIAATAAATSRTGWAFFAGSGFIDGQGAALEVLLMEHANRLGGVFLRCHFDKCESARPSRRAVLHNIDRNHSARLCEMILQIVLRCGERKVSNE